MKSVTVSQYVDVDVDLCDFDADDLAEALIKKNGWQAELDKALSGAAFDQFGLVV